MSRKRAIQRHLAPVPSEKPTVIGHPVTVELPTGGRFNVDVLLRELARQAFGPALTGFRFEITDGRPRAWVTCRPLSTFGHEQINAGAQRVTAALVVLGVVAQKPKAEPAPDAAPVTDQPTDEPTKTDAKCPPSSPAS